MMSGQLRDVHSELAAAIAAVMVVVGGETQVPGLPGCVDQVRPTTEDVRVAEVALLPWSAASRHLELSRALRIYERSRGRQK